MKRRVRGWNDTPLVADLYAVLAVVAALVVWTLCFDGSTHINKILDGARESVYRVMIGVSASLMGFSLTVISVVLGFSSHKRLALLRENEHYATLWKTFFGAVSALGSILLCALVALLLDRDASPVVGLEIALAGLCVLAILRLYRSVWILRQLVDLIAKPSKST